MSNKILLILLIPIQLMLCQSATYELPFASANNTIELAVENTTSLNVTGVKITAQNIPAWIRFTSTEQTINQLDSKQEKTALFSFSVGKSAPVKTEQTLSFQIRSSDGQTWSKEIRISVNPPDRFELFQNYPNPFNPSTAISYQQTVRFHSGSTIFWAKKSRHSWTRTSRPGITRRLGMQRLIPAACISIS